jgi:uncharacterized protein (TIGR02265 family)
MAEKLWFSQSIEGLFVRGIGKDMTPELRAQLKALGIDVASIQPAYENDSVVKAIKLAAATLYPAAPEREALREMGKLFMRGFADTLMGAALVGLMKVIGPRRSLERMERNFRTGGNYVQSKFTSLGKGKAQVWFNDVTGIPDFYAGIIHRGGEFAGAKNMNVTFDSPAAEECTFTVTWDE